MSNELVIAEQRAISRVWEESKDIIRKVVAGNATEAEFLAFCSYGKAIGANPLKKEIYFIKYGDKVSMVVSRDFHRKRAQEQPTHQGQTTECIYSNDDYQVKTTLNGLEVMHSRGIGNRGKLLGAYSLTYDSRLAHPHFEEVLLSNYEKNHGVWKDNKEAMIKKVASSVGYRAVYTGVLGNVYSEDEQWLTPKKSAEENAMQLLQQTAIPKITHQDTEPEETFEQKKERLKKEAMAKKNKSK